MEFPSDLYKAESTGLISGWKSDDTLKWVGGWVHGDSPEFCIGKTLDFVSTYDSAISNSFNLNKSLDFCEPQLLHE